ncbi:TPA: hypothetical protein O4I50_001225 [Vibrio parahaemolyticus]|nr:hypothetical protein [Vibrio parahaemolyticus]
MPIIKLSAKELLERGFHYKVEPSCITKQIRDVTALAIWSYLLTQSDGWEATQREVREHFGLSRDKTRAAFNLLMEMGLLVKRKKKDKTGKFLGDYYDCFMLPKYYQNKPQPDNQGVENQGLETGDDISGRGNDENIPQPDNQGVVFDSDNLGITDTCNPQPDNKAVDGQKVTQRLNIRPSNKRSILDQNNKPGGDVFDFVSGQHAYRDEQNKHDYSNPHPSIPSDELSPSEIEFFKMGQVPVRFKNGKFTDEQIEQIKQKNGLI